MLLFVVAHDAGRLQAQTLTDKQILVELYNSTGGSSWTNGWNTDQPLTAGLGVFDPSNTNWRGVATDSGGRVTRISLSSNNLTGTIPSVLGGLDNLEILELHTNRLRGEIPSSLSGLQALDTLNLSANQLSGSIPPELGQMPALLGLYLATNNLTGSIPSELGDLTTLTQLSLWNNQLTGQIPSELSQLSALTLLSLSQNDLTGSIPPSLGDLTNLTQLYLRNNRLTGSIPTQLGNLTNLTQLSLRNNQLTGSIPTQLGNLTSLTGLWLRHNQLAGSIPTQLGNLTNLTLLFLNDNQLTGSIPSQLGGLSNLLNLSLHNNQLTGSIPSELGDIGSSVTGGIRTDRLIVLSLHNNQLTGSIPSSLRSLTSLTELYLHDNELTGDVPDLNSLTSLYILGLGGNNFDLDWSVFESGGTGSKVYNLETKISSMSRLYLHESGLEGTIPDWIGAHSRLRTLWLQNNGLTGSIPSNFSSLTSLVDLRLHGNMLTGGFDVLDGLTLDIFSRDTAPGVVMFRTGTVVDSYAVKIAPPQGGAQPRFTLSRVSPEVVRLHLPPHPSISSVVRIVTAVDIEVIGDFTPPAVICVPVPDSPRQELEEDQELVLMHEFQDGVWRVLESADPPTGYDPGAGNIALCGMTDSFSLFGVAVVEFVSGGTGAIQRISRIEPSIRDVTLSQGDVLRLRFDIYGRQGILNNDLGEGHAFGWDDGGAGGSIRATDRSNEIVYIAPSSPGRYTVTATSPDAACLIGDDDEDTEERCAAKFTINVRRSSAVLEERPAPKNPVGEIPSVLADAEGRQYEVFTPEEGGFFDGGDITVSGAPGVVPNLEIVGVRVDAAGPASNVGMTAHRYTLVGDRYDVLAVDATETSISSYVLNSPLEVCVPLPPAARHDISDIALVADNLDSTLTVLSASVRITGSSGGVNVCGNLGTLPATIAVGTAGSPDAIPTATPDLDEIVDPDTGGYAPLGSGLLLVMMIGGGVIVAMGVAGVVRGPGGSRGG